MVKVQQNTSSSFLFRNALGSTSRTKCRILFAISCVILLFLHAIFKEDDDTSISSLEKQIRASSSDNKNKNQAEVTEAINSWEQIEYYMNKIDPQKAMQFKKFLEGGESKEEKKDVTTATITTTTTTLESLEDQRSDLNSEVVKTRRSEFEKLAAAIGGNDNDKKQQQQATTIEYANTIFTPSNLKKCKFVMLDFGSNIGDSMIKMIDSSFPEFDSGLHPEGEKLHHVFNATSGNLVGDRDNANVYDYKVKPRQRVNPNKFILSKWIQKKMFEYSKKSKTKVSPEDYCFYGVEGNPHFTTLLQKQEISIMNMEPRPLRHVHFLTEHVGSGTDGPTTLFLDTVNAKDNFWGSSVFQTHVDVKSSEQKEKKNTGVPVMGITLTKLLTETVSTANGGGGHVLIKIDIEGGEYALLEEAINSNILCTLIKDNGIKIDMLNEKHNEKIVGSEGPIQHWKDIQGDKQIKSCGVGLGMGKFTEKM